MSRDYLYIGSTVLYVIFVALFCPPLVMATSIGAAFVPWMGFWVFYIVAVVILAILWAIINVLRGAKPNLLGLKDERDKRLEAKAVMSAFCVLFGLSFPVIILLARGETLLAFKFLAGSGILAVGLLTLIASWDAVQTLRLSWGQN